MAPEVLESRPYDEKSDIWAIGCVAYEMCSLHRPYEALNTPALYIKILTGDRKELSLGYSSELRTVVDECMQGEANRRPTASDLLNKGHLRKQAIKLGSGVRLSVSKTSSIHQVSSETSVELSEAREQLLNMLPKTSEKRPETQSEDLALADVDEVGPEAGESECFNVMIDCETFASNQVWQSPEDAMEMDPEVCSPKTLWDQDHAEAGESLVLTATTVSSSNSVSRPLSCSISPEPRGRCFNWDDAGKIGTLTLSASIKLQNTKRSLTSLSCKTPSDEAILRDVLCDSPLTNVVQTMHEPLLASQNIEEPDIEPDIETYIEHDHKGIDENSVVNPWSDIVRESVDQQLTGLDPVDSAMCKWQRSLGFEVYLQRIGKGRYRCGDGKRVFCRINEKGNLVVRQGSKFVPIDEFFENVLQEKEKPSSRVRTVSEDMHAQASVNCAAADDALDAAVFSHFRALGAPMNIKQIGKGKYRYGRRRIFCRLTGDKRVMVRRNSDFIPLEDFLAANPQDEVVHIENPQGDEVEEDSDMCHAKDSIVVAQEELSPSTEECQDTECKDHELLNGVLKALQIKKRQLSLQLDETEARGRQTCEGLGHLWREACDMLESHLSDELIDEPQQLQVEKQLEQLLTQRSCNSVKRSPKAPLFLLCRRIHLQSEIEKCDLKLDEVLSMIQNAGIEPISVERPRRHSAMIQNAGVQPIQVEQPRRHSVM